MSPDKWTIKHLYHYYAGRKAATEKFYKEGIFSYSQREEVDKTTDEEYIQAMRLIFTRKELSYGMVLPVAEFAEEWNDGSFNECDGIGYFLDWDGNELGPINNFRKVPEGTRFVAWYNK